MSPNDHPTVAQGSLGRLEVTQKSEVFNQPIAGLKAAKSSNSGDSPPHRWIAMGQSKRTPTSSDTDAIAGHHFACLSPGTAPLAPLCPTQPALCFRSSEQRPLMSHVPVYVARQQTHHPGSRKRLLKQRKWIRPIRLQALPHRPRSTRTRTPAFTPHSRHLNAMRRTNGQGTHGIRCAVDGSNGQWRHVHTYLRPTHTDTPTHIPKDTKKITPTSKAHDQGCKEDVQVDKGRGGRWRVAPVPGLPAVLRKRPRRMPPPRQW